MTHSLLPDHLSPEVTFLIVAFIGMIVGKFFHRIKLPDITGQVLFGLIIGPSGYLILNPIFHTGDLTIFSHYDLESIKFISDIALGIMTFSIGTHLNYKMLHNSGSRIVRLAVFDSFFTFSLVFLVMNFVLKIDYRISLLLASIAIATAPGTVVSLIQKKFSRGVFTKTLVGVVALNNLATIFVFEIAKGITMIEGDGSFIHTVLGIGKPFLIILATIAFGIVSGLLVTVLSRYQHDKADLFTIVFLAIFFNIIACRYLNISPLLVNLTLGITFCNMSYHSKQVVKVFSNVNGLIFSVFFTLAGAHLDLSQLKIAGIAGAAFIVMRIIAKTLGAFTASKLFNYPDTIAKYLGIGLVPQAGLAIGLVINLSKYPELSDITATISTIVLAAVAVNEIIGPFTTSKSFDLAKETGQAAPRLIDFLHEEYILLPLKADDKWDAIEKMTDFLVKTNHIHSITRDDLLTSIRDRENQLTTALGRRMAIPHARIPSKEKLMGVIGILEKPLDWEALDDQPVEIVILIATPEGMDNLHVQLLGAIAKIFADDPLYQKKLVSANSAAEIYDLLQNKEIRDINSYLEEL